MRYLGKPEFRIQLDDLFTQETERLQAQIGADAFPGQGQWSQEEFRSRVRRYEALSEPLARMAGVLGRWGNGSDLPLIVDVLKSLDREAEKNGSGLTAWLNLRTYPAVLIFTAYGIGLTRGQRWDVLHLLLNAPLHRPYKESSPLVATLFLDAWKGTEQALWKQLEGFDNRRTPLSDHLLEVMSEWRTSFAGAASEFELLFERFETMASLAFFEHNDEASLEQALVGRPLGAFTYMPVGRVGWHTSSTTALIQELQLEATILILLQAGFAKGSRRLLELFVENFRRSAERMRW